MITFSIPVESLEKATNKAAELGATLTVVEEGKIWGQIVLVVNVVANQPENQPILLAYAHVDGERYSFSTAWQWTEENVNSIDFSSCDICNTKRDRKKIFIVDVNGKVLKVGGSCADNLNCEATLASLLKINLNIQEEIESEFGFSRESFQSVDSWLTTAAVFCKEFGFVSKKTADLNNSMSTYARVLDVIYPPVHAETAEIIRTEYAILSTKHLNEVEKSDGYWTEATLAYLNSKEFSEYIHNCRIAIQTGKEKMLGYTVSAVGMLLKEKTEAVAKFVRTETPVTGDKITVNGVIVRKVSDENKWGTSLKVTIDDSKYGKVWVRTTAAWAYEASEGNKIECVINVKEVKDNIIFAARASKVVVSV